MSDGARIVMTPDAKKKLRPEFRGYGSAIVRDDGAVVSITVAPTPTVAPGDSSSAFVWAQVTAVNTNNVTAKLMDATGAVIGDPLTVKIFAGNDTGTTIAPTVSLLTPHLVIGSFIRIVSMTGPGTTSDTVSWWMFDTYTETCT